jgi:hypothetical protein
MSKYTEAEIARIINDCEILFVPDGSTVDDAGEGNEPSISYRKSNPKSLLLTRYLNEAGPEEVAYEYAESENFEKIYSDTKLQKETLNVSIDKLKDPVI